MTQDSLKPQCGTCPSSPPLAFSCLCQLEEKESPVLTSFSFPKVCSCFPMPRLGSCKGPPVVRNCHPCGSLLRHSAQSRVKFADTRLCRTQKPRYITSAAVILLSRWHCRTDASCRGNLAATDEGRTRSICQPLKLCCSPQFLMGFARMFEILVKFFFKALPQGDLLQFGELVWILSCRQAAFISVFFFYCLAVFQEPDLKRERRKTVSNSIHCFLVEDPQISKCSSGAVGQL